MTRVVIPPEIRAEAAAWLARLRADGKNPADERTFQAWLASDPVHASAFEAVTEVWEAAGAVRPEPAERKPFVTRRRAMFAGTAAAAAALTGVYISSRSGAYAAVYETAVGEQKHVALADGTQVFLDTDTRIQASYNSETRLVALERGRCNIRVMENDKRPFMVDAAARRIVAERTTFDVQRDGDEVCVILLQGSARVGGPSGQGGVVLKSGERLVGDSAHVRVDRPRLVPLLAWQTGQAVFENDTLTQAIREMNRYSAVKLAAGDPVVADMRISGVYRVGDNAAFALSVAALLPVDVQFEPDQVRFVVDPVRVKKG